MPQGSGSGQVNVDGQGLDTFATQVDTQTNKGFTPEVHRLYGIYGMGTPFGQTTHSAEVQAAQRKHHDSVVKASELLAYYVEASQGLIDAVKWVREKYLATDQMAKLSADDINNTLTHAIYTQPDDPALIAQRRDQAMHGGSDLA